MNFNNPLPRTGLADFNEASRLRSPRDSDAVPRLWQKSKNDQQNLRAIGEATERTIRELQRLRRRKFPQDGFAFHPFKMIPVPANLCIDPSTFSGTTGWTGGAKTWQIRSGYAAFRPKWHLENLVNNNEAQYYVSKGSGGDGSHTGFGLKTVAWESPEIRKATESIVVGNVGDFGASTNSFCEFVLDEERDADEYIGAFFFVLFEDSDDELTSPTVQIKCRMVSYNPGTTGRAAVTLPNDQNVIPIGYVWDFSATGLNVQPWLLDHCVNRYGHFPGFGPMNFRGEWSEDETAQPGQIFYPGDVVTVGRGGATGELFYSLVRITFGRQALSPSSGAGDWLSLSRSLLP